MKFTVNTKPLNDALSLAVVDANIISFYKPSIIAQITATRDKLIMNFSAQRINTQVTLYGRGDSDEEVTCIVVNKTLKQLISSLETNLVTIEFVSGGIVIHSGKSKYTLSAIVEDDSTRITAPKPVNEGSPSIPLNKDEWKFIKDKQMFAIAMAYAKPAYTRVWIGDDGDILSGDFDRSVFTHSAKSTFSHRCLVADTIVNLFCSLPDGAVIRGGDGCYVVSVDTDSFNYISEIFLEYESNPDMGDYHPEILLQVMVHPDSNKAKIRTASVDKLLSQSFIFLDGGKADATIDVSFNENNELRLHDESIDGTIEVVEGGMKPFTVQFRSELLAKVLGVFTDEFVTIAPSIDDETNKCDGILFYDDNLSVMLAGVQ